MGGELDKARRAASQDRNPDAYVVRLRDLRVALAEVDRLHTVIGNHARALGEATSDLAALRIEHAAWGALLDATRADRDAARAEVAAYKVRVDGIEAERVIAVDAFHRIRRNRDDVAALANEARAEADALRVRVAELERLQASILKAADAARKAERADVVAFLGKQAGSFHATNEIDACATLAGAKMAIQHGAHEGAAGGS